MASPKPLRKWGFILFVLSFVTPNWRFEGMGCGAFVVVPYTIWAKFAEGDVHDWQMIILISGLLMGWLSNFTVFFPLSRKLALAAAAAPWILYLAMILFSTTNGRPDFGVVGFIPFYPWAFGIGMISVSRLSVHVREPQPQQQIGAQTA